MNYRILELKQSAQFINMSGVTQVLTAGVERNGFYKNRQSHVIEVEDIALLISKAIGFKNKTALSMVCLAHDLGHSPFGHDGQKVLNRMVIEAGLIDGFSDNNNNFNVIFNNGLNFSEYELASLIKYPDELYEDQKALLLPLLNKAIVSDKKKYSEALKRTMACEIMDFADEIAYGTSDIFDGFSLGYTDNVIIDFLTEQVELSNVYLPQLTVLLSAAKTEDKRLFRKSLFEIKVKMIKDSYFDAINGKMSFKAKESRILLNKLISFTYKNFIKNDSVLDERYAALDKFKTFIDYFLTCDIDEIPSKMYRMKLENSKSEIESLKLRRDMIADTSDQYVLNF